MNSFDIYGGYGDWCECCDSALNEDNLSPDPCLCIDCYADSIIGDECESAVRDFLTVNRCGFVSFLRGERL